MSTLRVDTITDAAGTGTPDFPNGLPAPASTWQASTSSGSYSKNTTTLADITNLTLSVTTDGRPVRLKSMSGSATTSYFKFTLSGGPGSEEATIFVDRDGSNIAAHKFGIVTANTGQQFTYSPSIIEFTDDPGAGTYTYKLRVSLLTGGGGATNFEAKDIILTSELINT